jgi:hypothetical protein
MYLCDWWGLSRETTAKVAALETIYAINPVGRR